MQSDLFFGVVFKIISSLPQLLENTFLIAKKRPSTVPVQLIDGRIVMMNPAEPVSFGGSLPVPVSSIAKPAFNLKNLSFSKEAFSFETLEHIFFGVIKKGKAIGFHYNGIHNGFCEIIEGTKKFINEFNCYEANVKIGGIIKKAKSTFFPDKMNPQEVINAIMEAYENRKFSKNNQYIGVSKSGLKIEMCLDKKQKIITAYPI